MASNQQDVVKSDISPVLFMAVDGEPMSFFLRPGPVKRKLQPLIIAGGGALCSVQQPGAILLIDPEERGSLLETTAHWYVSTQYIHDCIEKEEQLNLEDYRLNPEGPPRSGRPKRNKERSSGLSGGRAAYTADDDAAILSYVSKHKKETGGNRLWQKMEKQRVTTHSWQSMKYRYRVQLAKKQPKVTEMATVEGDAKAAEGDTKVEGNQETDVEKPSSAEEAASPQTHSTDSDPTQQLTIYQHQTSNTLKTKTLIDAQSTTAESTQPKIVEAPPIPPQGEEHHVNSQTDEQPAESTQVETVGDETSNSPKPEGPCLDPPTDAHPAPAESEEPETDETQMLISPQKESMPEDSLPAQPKSLPDTPSQKKPKEKQKASLGQEELPRRLTRRQQQLGESTSPEPYGKKLRSSASSAEQPSSSPQPSKKTKSALKSALQKDTTVEQPPSKKARRNSVTAVSESPQEKSGPATVSETTQADTESDLMPPGGEKKTEKRKLGILELATKELEDSDEDEAPDLQNPTETATSQPTSTEPTLPTPDTAAPTQSDPKPGPGLQEIVQETQPSSINSLPPTGDPEPAAAEPAAAEPAAAEPAAAEPAAAEPAVVNATSKAHLFIFDSESQEDDSQSVVSDNRAAPANPEPTVTTGTAFSLTQVQLEEDKQRIRELMKETDQDLVSVTKALLKTSGDFAAARGLLLEPFSASGPFWSCRDDDILLSGDPVVRQQLQEKYGAEEVTKRIVFLEVEG